MTESPPHDREIPPTQPPSRMPGGAPHGDSGEVILEATRRGREELKRSRYDLGAPQRRLLALLDGRRTLAQCAAADLRLQPARLARDGARLVAFGLARPVRGELPQDLLLAAMNLTARIPLDELPPLEPERTVSPMEPRVGASPNRPAPAPAARPPANAARKPIVLLLALVAAAVAAIGYLS